MKRRDFLKNAVFASATAGIGASAMGQGTNASVTPESGREVYELREYRLKPGAPSSLLESYLAKALIPAMNRAGATPVGVFREMDEPKDGPGIWVLIPHRSADAFAAAALAIPRDPQYLEAGQPYLEVGKDAPAFDRIDSWLLLAFSGMPRLELPVLARQKENRVFEMRTYESYSEAKALKKIQMFNSGEIGVMKEVDLSPVFYGQALAGKDLPHLTYMLCGKTRELHKKHFTAFTRHPIWLKLKDDPEYADTVSKIISRFLEPLSFSQI